MRILSKVGQQADGGTLPDLARVVVVGTSCSGKSTFARDLARRLETEHVELDALFWLPGWTKPDEDDFRSLVEKQVSGDRWVVDGNYRGVRDIVWARATAVIWLDYPFRLILWRSLKRTISRAVTREEICNGNRESFRKSFLSRDSILLWVIKSDRSMRRRYQALFTDDIHANAARIRLSRPADAAAFLARVTSASPIRPT